MPDFRLPTNTQRLAIIGRTGTGKTQAGVWHLSMRDFDAMPWLAFNFKDDDLLRNIPGRKELTIDDKIPTKPGVYVVDVAPDEKEEADEFLMRAWEAQNVGLYIDEGYMLTGLKGYRRCLTQGRSRHLPMIVLSQRPVYMDRFTWTEADFFQVFQLSIADDRASVRSYIGDTVLEALPQYHSHWYDVAAGAHFALRPVPDRDTLYAEFRDRLGVKRRLIA